LAAWIAWAQRGHSIATPMPRPNRICLPGLPHHVLQRGNDRQRTFFRTIDYLTYLGYLAEASAKHRSAIHAFVLMTNHVHLLVTPSTCDGLSLTMQALGRKYVSFVNRVYQRTGTLWEGRFKSSVVTTERYCLTCYRYIELNPVRAGIVTRADDYAWSSYHANALGVPSNLVTPHPAFLELAPTAAARQSGYRSLVEEALTEDELRAIRLGTKRGRILGSDPCG
jgi:putative transposase